MMNHLDDKSFFKEIKKESQNYSEDITEGFPYFCLKIFWDDLSEDNIRESLIGLSTNDDSIDAFYVDEENKEINIIQCKSCSSEKNQKSLKKEWLAYLQNVPEKLKDNSYIDGHKNGRMKEIAEDFITFNKQGYKTKLHFFHLGRSQPNIIKHYEGKIEYYDWSKIKDEYEEYRSRLDRTEPPEIGIPLSFDPLEPNINQKHKTLVSIITGDEIVKLRKTYRYKLFDKNLRFGLGKNKINNAIMKTAQSEPTNFYFYNNGITITSKGFKYKPTNSMLNIKYPQIINGAQTVNAIYESYKERKNKIARHKPGEDSDKQAQEELKSIKLLFRVIQDEEKDGKKTSKFEENVIRHNNTQNSIKETDFYANNPEQIKLQELMSNFGYFYEIKRGDRKYLENGREQHNLLKKKKNTFNHWEENINIESLATLWMAYKIDPNLSKIKKSNIFGYAQDKYYENIFKDIDEKKTKEMIFAYNLFDVISQQADIYGSTKKRGQIISKVSQIQKENKDFEKTFSNINGIVADSFLFGDIAKKWFSNPDTFLTIKNN